MKEDIYNLMIVQAFYEIVTYEVISGENLLPTPDETEFYQVKEDVIFQLSNGTYIRYSPYWKDYSILKISLVDSLPISPFTDSENLKSIYSQKILKSEYYYIQESYVYQRTTYVSDQYIPEGDLGAICLFFENGRKLIILSGRIEEGEHNHEIKVFCLDSLLLLIFDSTKYTYTNLPEHWI